jgi:hypothetical protein
MAKLTPYSNKLAGIWRQALESTILTPGPAGGPEYITTPDDKLGSVYLLRGDRLLLPLVHSRTRHYGVVSADLYEGMQSSSILGAPETAAEVETLLSGLPPRCNVLLQVPEETYPKSAPLFDKLNFLPRQSFVYHLLEISDDYDEWFNRHAVKRILIRKARKHGVTVRLGGRELLPEFYELYLKSFQRWEKQGKASWCHPIARFERMFDVPDSGLLIGLADMDNRVVASTMLCAYRRTAAGLYGGIDYDYRGSKASNLLYAEIIRHLIKQSVKLFNMGTSNGLRGVEAFKESLGARPKRSIILERHRFPRLRRLLKGPDLQLDSPTGEGR